MWYIEGLLEFEQCITGFEKSASSLWCRNASFQGTGTQWSRKPKNVQKFRITLFWHVVGLRDVNFTKM